MKLISLRFHWIFSLIEKYFRFLAGLALNQDLLFFICTFVLIQKYQKIKTANKFLKFCSITLQKKNSSGRNRTQTAFSVHASFHKIFRRNLFEVNIETAKRRHPFYKVKLF